MELNFIENENQDWVAEFEATGDFNLHLERDLKGTIIILLKQNEEDEYAFSSEFPNYYKIFNYDFAALLYPKYIKVISDSKVIKGSVNFNEGGGSGNEAELNYYKFDYTAIESIDNFWDVFDLTLDCIALFNINGTVMYGGILRNFGSGSGTVHGIAGLKSAINIDALVDNNDWILNVEEYIKINNPEAVGILTKGLTPITKEEFYNLEA